MTRRKLLKIVFVSNSRQDLNFGKCWHGKSVKISIVLCLIVLNEYQSKLHNFEIYSIVTKRIIITA